MAYALVHSGEDRDYHKCVIEFLEMLEDMDVNGVVLIADTEEGPAVSRYCTMRELGAAAASLQALFADLLMYGDDEDEFDDEQD